MIFVGYDKSFYENDKLAIIHDILSRKNAYRGFKNLAGGYHLCQY